MDYLKAFSILEININEIDINDITLDYLKKKYHKMALQNHPDKNGNTLESNNKFKEINEAYTYLKNEIKHINKEKPFNDDYVDNDNNPKIYNDFVELFINSFMEGNYSSIIKNYIKEIITGCTQISLKIFEDLDKNTMLNIYTFLSKNSSLLNLNLDILEQIKQIVLNKYENIQLYKLNPSINDLLSNNIYKLYVGNELCLIPLWWDESHISYSGGEIIVICEPELPSNIKLDEYNNIYTEIKLNIINDIVHLISNNKDIIIEIGYKKFNIPISELYFKKEQIYLIKNQGITCPDENDINNIKNKSDIIVKIILE
jgi:hypothetical protein